MNDILPKNHQCIEIHELTNKFSYFQEFTKHFLTFHESRTFFFHFREFTNNLIPANEPRGKLFIREYEIREIRWKPIIKEK